LTSAVAAGALAMGLSFAPTASASDGCNQGYHLENGACIETLPGPGAHFVNNSCWINDQGDERCYPGT
jgi:hypothetical protein